MSAAPRKPILLPTIATAVMLAMLIALGVWQLQRREWKTALLAEIDAAEAAPPIPLGADLKPFSKVAVTGTLRQDLRAYYANDVRLNQMGTYLVEPLERPGQPTVLIDRGWVPDGYPDPPVPPGTFTGYIRPPDKPGTFTPADDPATRHFYTLDPARIAASLGLANVAPFTLIELGTGDGLPQAASALPRPPNDHLNYAMTWFGLGIALIAVFTVYVRKARS